MRETFFVVGAALTLMASPAYALIGLNQCGVGSSPPAGMNCGHSDLLLGYRDASGRCAWVCCPPNSDGTYNCTGPPTYSDKLDLGKVRARPPVATFRLKSSP
jgi:hypothetical protein